MRDCARLESQAVLKQDVLQYSGVMSMQWYVYRRLWRPQDKEFLEVSLISAVCAVVVFITYAHLPPFIRLLGHARIRTDARSWSRVPPAHGETPYSRIHKQFTY